MKVSILGAGDLGATIAQKLADEDWAGEILLLDPDQGVAMGKALDLLEAGPVLRSGTVLRGTHALDAIERSHYVVVADAGGLRDMTAARAGERLSVFEKLAPETALVVAVRDAAPVLGDLLRFSIIDPRRVWGSFPESLASVWRRFLGDQLGCSPQDIRASLLGAPPEEGRYVTFASLAGQPVELLLSPPELNRISEQVRHSALGPRNLASAAVDLLKALAFRQGAVRSCYVWADGAYGGRNLFLCAPVVLGPRGSNKILEFRLEPRAAVVVARALDHLAHRFGCGTPNPTCGLLT